MLKILIVDDEPTVRRGVALGVDWAKLGCRVVGEASNGLEGLAAAERCRPDLIITDVRMPHMDGIEMLRELRRQGSTARVILLTAYSDFSYARSALQLDADDYLLKPFRDQELAAAITRVQGKLCRNTAPAQEPIRSDAADGKSRYVRQAMDYIAGHSGDPEISITSIAEALSVSEGHLSHLFKKETGCTVLGYLTQYRMQRAMELLKDRSRKIYEVAAEVGYGDVTYFSSIFKKHVGISPSEYQEHCK